MGKRLIRENILATRALVQLPWLEAVQLFFDGNERKIRMYKFVMLPYPTHYADGVARTEEFIITNEEIAEIIALIGAPLSHGQHIRRISAVTEKVAIRYTDAIHWAKEEKPHETEVRRARAAKAERLRMRKLPRA